jgi:hypothetical protein
MAVQAASSSRMNMTALLTNGAHLLELRRASLVRDIGLAGRRTYKSYAPHCQGVNSE